MASLFRKCGWLIAIVGLVAPVSAQEKGADSNAQSSITQAEAESFLGEFAKAYESKDVQKVMSFIPQSMVGRDGFQDAVEKDFATFSEIRVDVKDIRVVQEKNHAIIEAFCSRKAMKKADSKGQQQEGKTQIFLVRDLHGKVALDPNHSTAKILPFIGSH